MAWIKRSYLSLVYLFLYVPIAVVVLFSFNKSEHSLIWHGFSSQWYNKLLHDPSLMTVTGHSFFLAFLASVTATILGTMTTIAFYRYRIWRKNLWSGLLFSFIMIPDLILAVAFLSLFQSLSLSFGFWTLWIAHTAFCLPFVFIVITSSIQELNPHLQEAALDLGANESQIIFRVLIPALRPAMLTGALMSFALSLDDVVVSYFTSGPDFQILPLKIYAMARLGANPEINALCSILFLTTLILVVISQRLLKRDNT